MGTRVAVYARISDDRTGEAAGVDRQQQDATALAEKRGWTVSAVLVDNDLSASRYAKKSRPAYAELLHLIQTGQIDAISVWHTDRLYRQPRELEHLIDLVEQRGILVATCEGELDLGTSDGRAFARILVTMAAKSSDDKSRRLRRKHEALAAEGRYQGGGRRAFGFERDGVTLRPSEADLIRDAAARIVAGESVRSICTEWTDRGVSTVSGAAWQTTTVKRMLMSPRLAGMRTHKGKVTPAVWPAILDDRTHKRLKAILSDPARNKVAGVAASRYLLTGLVHCGGCGTRMTTHQNRYVCSRERAGCGRCGISARGLERDMTAAVLAEAGTAQLRARMTDRAGSGVESALVDDITQAEAELGLLAQDYAERRVGRDGYLAAVTALEQRLDDLRRTLTRRRSTVDTVALVASTDLDATWDRMGFDRQRAAIAQLVARIDIALTTRTASFYDPERASVTWR